eukprot:88244_1
MIQTDNVHRTDRHLSNPPSNPINPSHPSSPYVSEYGKSAINGWSQCKGHVHRPSGKLPYIPPPDFYTDAICKQKRKRVPPPSNGDAMQKRKRVPPPSAHNKHQIPPNTKARSMETTDDKIINDLISLGFTRQDVLQSISDVNVRMSWKMNSNTLIYSRRKQKWFKGQVAEVRNNEATKEKWLTVQYNDGNT